MNDEIFENFAQIIADYSGAMEIAYEVHKIGRRDKIEFYEFPNIFTEKEEQQALEDAVARILEEDL